MKYGNREQQACSMNVRYLCDPSLPLTRYNLYGHYSLHEENQEIDNTSKLMKGN